MCDIVTRHRIRQHFTLTLCQHPYGVIKRHRLDVEGGEDGLLVRHSGVIIGGDLEQCEDDNIASSSIMESR